MTAFNSRGSGKLAAALLLGVALAVTPAVADKGGNGGNAGNGGNGGNSSQSSGGNGGSHAKSDTQQGKSATSQKASKTNKTKKSAETDDDATDTASANSFGNINGFLHASPKALANASPKSVIGRVMTAYGAQLQSYLDASATAGDGSTDDTATTTAPTAADLQAALQKVSNKPVTAEMIAAVNDKLIATNPALSASLANSGKTVDQLDAEISAGL